MRIRVLPYKQGSRTAKAVADALGGKRIRLNESNYIPRRADWIINWGNSGFNHFPHSTVNHPINTGAASDKRVCLLMLRENGVRTPRFTINKEEAQRWNSPVIVRSKLTGRGGEDATFVEGGELIPDGKLYTQYIKKFAEYRVHVFCGKVLDVQQKRKRNGEDNADFRIRNHSRGWVFCRNSVDPPNPDVLEQAIKSVNALGLNFGAVDVIWNNLHQQAFVLEVNTAPGLEATTLENYIAEFKEMIDG